MSDIAHPASVLLSNETNIVEKMRALFTLRNIDTDESAIAIEGALSHASVLLKHECVYVLGQMVRACSVKKLVSLLENKDEDEIVRHEAAEALGNYESEDHVRVLERFVDDESTPVRESCIVAIEKIRAHDKNMEVVFSSRDPAYPLAMQLKDAERYFTDPTQSLYKRYQIMFHLRNLMTEEAVEILVKGFSDDSALFKHEIAFVLGQMEMAEATTHLIKVLADESQHGMVRHECAEALGAIGTEQAKKALEPFLTSKVDIIRESVEVALDIHSYKGRDENDYFLV
jgi:deoxyhypusine monooxygenase